MHPDSSTQDRLRARAPFRRGAVIALVGPDASGKTTLSRALTARFGETRPVASLHLGGPPRGTWLTRWPRVAVEAARKIVRVFHGDRSFTGIAQRYPVFQAALDLLTALDRRMLVRRCHRLAARGTLVFTDRYPGRDRGAASGPRLLRRGPAPARALRSLELRVYRSLPVPHLVLTLRAPVELTVRRNAVRERPKPVGVIRRSHRRAELLAFPGATEATIDGAAPVDAMVADAEAVIRGFLEGC